MHYRLLTLVAGIFSPLLLPALPPVVAVTVAMVISSFWLLLNHGRSLCSLFILGFGWACLWGHDGLSHRLPVPLDKSDAVVTGIVTSLPQRDGRKQSFRFAVESVNGVATELPPLRDLRLSWYNHDGELRLGQHWQMKVRLRAPRGFSNPGTFDYESWLFAEGFSATGYVIDDRARLLSVESSSSLTRWRQWLFSRINQHSDTVANGYLAALVLGEKGAIAPNRIRQLIDSGLIHLLVVSGLHIGIMATLGFWGGLGVGRLLVALGMPLPAAIIAGLISLTVAVVYGALTGFGLPARRALIMVGVVLWALMWRRPVRAVTLLSMALAGVAIVDPLAVLRMGFWLSFAAVAALLLYFVPRPETGRITGLFLAQPVVCLGLAPWLLFFQGRLNLLMIPFNLVFIPWISLIVTPLCLLGALFQWLPAVGDTLWGLARWQLSCFDQLLARISSWSEYDYGWYLYTQSQSYVVLVLGLIAIAPVLLLPRGTGLRMGGAILMVAVILSAPEYRNEPRLRITVLDVGQGTAIVVQVADKTLVYDTGAAFSDSFDAGSGIVAPYLFSKGVRTVEKLIVSHSDGDHSGGTNGLLRSLEVKDIVTSDPDSSNDWSLGAAACRQQQKQGWQWQDVRFSFLWPPELSANDNNNSCVLLIELMNAERSEPVARVLLPGDIEASAEKLILSRYDLNGLAVVVAPHHGSKTSSSRMFVAETVPDHVVFSAGFNHHFGHPHETVVSRYRPHSQIWSTANSGAIEFEWRDDFSLAVSSHRASRNHYWDTE